MKIHRIQSDYLWFLTLSFSIVILLANWFDARLIKIFGATTDAGTIIFPLTFLLSDLITEVYGYKYARRAIWCGFLFNVIFIIYGQIIIHLPSPDFPTNNAMFDTLFALNARIIVGSVLSYFISEPCNAFLLAKLKIRMSGHWMGIRFVVSTLFASGLDSFIFGFVAFYGTIDNLNLTLFIMTMWFFKIAIELLGLPISIKLARKLKKVDKIDMYDVHTNFNLFRLETHYSSQDNEYKK